MATRKTSAAKAAKAAKPVESAEDKAAKPTEPAEDKAAEPVEPAEVATDTAGKQSDEAIIAKVTRRFRDKDTLSTLQPGMTIAVSPERFEEICAAGNFLERIQ